MKTKLFLKLVNSLTLDSVGDKFYIILSGSVYVYICDEEK